MKPNEIINLEEGVGDFFGRVGARVKDEFAKKGWFGRSASDAAWGAEAQKRQAAQQQGAEKQRIQQYIDNLAIALARAYSSGTVAESVDKVNYELFTRIVENRILSEAYNAKDFISKYVDTVASKEGIKITPDVKTEIDTLIGTLATNFSYNPSIQPEKQKFSGNAAAAATKIFDALLSLKGMPAPDTTARYGAPKGALSEPIDIRGVDFEWDAASSTWLELPGRTPVTDPGEINNLNRLAYEREKSKPRAPAAAPVPTTDVPVDRASGSTWKPEGATNSYTFNKTQGKWYMHRPAPAGSTSSPMPTPITDPKTIERLNKLWDEKGELE